MKGDLLFSVIIPTYNRANHIALSLQSVLDQRYRNFEVIIVDDGSTDNTDQVVNSIHDDRIRYFKILNSERGAARNFGVRNAIGDYVTFLDSDDMLYPHYLGNAARCLTDLNFPVFFHQKYEVKSSSGHSVRYANQIDEGFKRSLVKGNPMSCLGVFIHRDEAVAFPFVEERDLSGSEDWELWLRLSANFGLQTNDVVSSCLIIHDDRSVLSVNEDKLVRRKNLALDYAFKDEMVQKVYANRKKQMEAYCDTYISLHLALARENFKAIKYLWHAACSYFPSLFQRRVLAVFKHLFLNLFLNR